MGARYVSSRMSMRGGSKLAGGAGAVRFGRQGKGAKEVDIPVIVTAHDVHSYGNQQLPW